MVDKYLHNAVVFRRRNFEEKVPASALGVWLMMMLMAGHDVEAAHTE